MTARIVQTRPLHQSDEQCDFRRRQLARFASEIKFRRRGESVHGLPALLTEKNLVHVRFENSLFVVTRFDEHREQRFVELAREALAAIEKKILDELLRKRAAALHDVARGEFENAARTIDVMLMP